MLFSGVSLLKTAQFLFWLGVVIMVVGVLANGYTFVWAISHHLMGYNFSNFAMVLLSPLGQGGLLIGIAKILEEFHSRPAR